MDPRMYQEPAILDEDTVRYRRIKKKAYVRLVTNLGPLNMELHCDIVPKTCENFIKLNQKGYYNETIFHRSVKYFMVSSNLKQEKRIKFFGGGGRNALKNKLEAVYSP